MLPRPLQCRPHGSEGAFRAQGLVLVWCQFWRSFAQCSAGRDLFHLAVFQSLTVSRSVVQEIPGRINSAASYQLDHTPVAYLSSILQQNEIGGMVGQFSTTSCLLPHHLRTLGEQLDFPESSMGVVEAVTGMRVPASKSVGGRGNCLDSTAGLP